MRFLHTPQSEPGQRPQVRRGYLRFAVLFSLSIAARALLLTTMPLRAFQLLQDEALIGLVYLAGSFGSLALSLSLPAILARLPRAGVMLIGTALAAGGPLLCTVESVPVFMLGLAAQLAAVALIEITLNLYVLDHVPRRSLGHFEPLRMFFSAAAWTGGPVLGVYLAGIAPNLPFYLSGTIAGLLAAIFLLLRPQALTHAPRVDILSLLLRYFRQPRLRLAWVLAFGRATWWTLFFVYGQIFLVERLGYDTQVAGLLSSIVMGATFLVPAWGWLVRRYGVRRMLTVGYLLSGSITLLLAAVGQPPWLAATILVVAGLATSIIDGAGNVIFLRAVKPSQRSQMTAVFMTYRDASQLLPPAIFSGLLALFPFWSLFLVTGSAMIGLTSLVRFIPRRL